MLASQFSVSMGATLWRWVLSVTLTSVITGCQLSQMPALQPIEATAQQLQNSSGKASLQGKVVALQGTVADLVPLAGGEIAYELRDTTGSVWVLAKTKKVELGHKVDVRGKVYYQSAAVGEPNQSRVYVEQEG